MPDNPTERFFRWLDAYGIKRSDAASMLEVDERSLSSYRSRGLPVKKWPLAERLMSEALAPTEVQSEDNKVHVTLTDEQFDMIDKAAGIVQTPFKEFLLRAAIQRAKEEIARDSQNSAVTPFKVAEDPAEFKAIPRGADLLPSAKPNPPADDTKG